MIELRPFLNSDSPGIAAVWSEQPPLRRRLPKVTPDLLEQHVFSKPYFDPRGLTVAVDAGQLAGFIHVGYSPPSRPGEFDFRQGIICQLMVAPRPDSQEVAAKLLKAGELQLKSAGAVEVFGGGVGVHAPYYLGLYGGCQLPGVLIGDVGMAEPLRAAGYLEHRQTLVWERDLAAFRPPIDRELVALRRQFQLQPQQEIPVEDWNDACAFAWVERTGFDVTAMSNGASVASLTFWDMLPLASTWGLRVMGLADFKSRDEGQGPGLLTCFLAESMRRLHTQGAALLEVQADSSDANFVAVCRKLAFRAADRGIQFRKILQD